jgi:hypothetical protein
MEKYNEKNPSNVYEKFHGIPWKIPQRVLIRRSLAAAIIVINCECINLEGNDVPPTLVSVHINRSTVKRRRPWG